MSKVLPATCEGGTVTAQGSSVPGAVVLSKGVAASAGIVVLDAKTAHYLANTVADLETTLTQIVTALEKVEEALTKTGQTFTATFATMTGPTTAPPPTGPTNVAAITVAVSAIATARGQLNTLKGNLK